MTVADINDFTMGDICDCFRQADFTVCPFYKYITVAVSDIDDFIVDDEGRPISKGKKKKHIIHSDK